MVKVDKLPSGKYRTRVLVGDGKYKTFTAETKKEVQLLAAQFEAGLTAEPKPDKQPLTLNNAITRYIEIKRNVLSPSTACGYRQIQRNWLQSLMQKNIYEITHDDVQREINSMSVRLSAKSVRNAHGLLSAIMKYYRSDFQMDTTLPRKVHHEIEIPTESDIKALYEYFSGTDMLVPFVLGAVCGLRESEIMGLKWDCVNLESGSALIKEAIVPIEGGYAKKGPKSDSGYREIRLFPTVLDALRAEKRDGDYVTKLTGHAMYMRTTRALEKLNLKHYRYHDLRHYAVSVMIALNVPLQYIVSYFGHKDETMARQVYGHIMAQKKSEVDDLVQDYFEKNILKSVTKSVTKK